MQIQHGTGHLTDAEILRRWLDTIPRGEYNNVIAKLVETCLIQIYKIVMPEVIVEGVSGRTSGKTI